jgi:flagellar basal-body rod protein FlgC
MFNTLDMAVGGLQAQRTRMDVIAGNVLNSQTTRNTEGESIPYRRRVAMLEADGNGVKVAEIAEDPSQFNVRLQPGHADADPETGLVQYPNVDVGTEYVNMLEASRAYEAGVTLMQTTKSMVNSALRIIA